MLTDGTTIELSKLGAMRTQLIAQLRDARAEVAAAEPRTVLNRALDDAGFAAADVRAGLTARIPHDAGWLRRLTGLLSP